MQWTKLRILPFFIALSLLILAVYISKNKQDVINYRIEDKTYRLIVADSPREWTRGLMFKKNLKNADGMLFIFPHRQKPVFYNKNTYLDLDVYWIDGSSVIAKTHLASIKKTKIIVYVQPPDFVDKVAEIVRK
ncbi:MAG: DUF192 domain-containing protein [Endomicrobia bacterium]|nr:DUF192 domain-containing protein [Endomicrobiia bacterium]